jgi:DNA-binding SARP family transcriptional activator
MRREIARGAGQTSRIAADLLDEYGEVEDVARLRAYAKTYSRGRRVRADLGRALARRVGDRLEIKDLGRVRLKVGAREFALSKSRRKAASLLMYLVTRPNLTATREQVLDELWPDADPGSAANSLNQSLYFLRRDIDPWYEDELSMDYLRFEGDLVWIDTDLVVVESVEFLRATGGTSIATSEDEIVRLIGTYTGQFAPEFEYEEWAIGWRSRLHASFLDLANGAIDSLIRRKRFAVARDIAAKALAIDPEAREIEESLIYLYERLGAHSAALAQYDHLAARDRAEGNDPPSLTDLIMRLTNKPA